MCPPDPKDIQPCLGGTDLAMMFWGSQALVLVSAGDERRCLADSLCQLLAYELSVLALPQFLQVRPQH
jgi:hypothetical protein